MGALSMNILPRWKECLWLSVALITLAISPQLTNAVDDAVDFNRQIRPILSDNCFKCHGPDKHERFADLRLDVKQGLDDAHDLISPGDVHDSEFLRRLNSDDQDEIMPPADSGRVLSAKQIAMLTKWVKQGAKWNDHWSFVDVEKQAVPSVESDWASNEIDRFVLDKLNSKGLAPNPVADRNTLIRRLCLDLTGLPPTPELVSEFTQSKSGRWYEELVERLFQSPHYGEHMARYWLDASRYADTHGLHLDNYREMWMYRDWVVRAFNNNLPYKEFVIEQLAGDLLDEPTEDQLIATGFNRAHVTTNEGGSIVEEVLVRNVVDRVSTTGTVFMGLTIGCAQCHDHKYDPISQKDFYSLYAFFNSLDGNAMDQNIKAPAPVLKYFDEHQKQQIKNLTSERKVLQSEIDQAIAGFKYVDPLAGKNMTQSKNPTPVDIVWFDDVLPENAKKTGDWKVAQNDEHKPQSGESSFVTASDEFTQLVAIELSPRLRFNANDKLFGHVYLDPENPPKQIMLQFNDGAWEHRAYWGDNKITFGKNNTTSRIRLGDIPETGKWIRLEVLASDVGFKDGATIGGIAFSQQGGKMYWDSAGVTTDMIQTFNEDSFVSWRHFQASIKGADLPRQNEEAFFGEGTRQQFGSRPE